MACEVYTSDGPLKMLQSSYAQTLSPRITARFQPQPHTMHKSLDLYLSFPSYPSDKRQPSRQPTSNRANKIRTHRIPSGSSLFSGRRTRCTRGGARRCRRRRRRRRRRRFRRRRGRAIRRRERDGFRVRLGAGGGDRDGGLVGAVGGKSGAGGAVGEFCCGVPDWNCVDCWRCVSMGVVSWCWGRCGSGRTGSLGYGDDSVCWLLCGIDRCERGKGLCGYGGGQRESEDGGRLHRCGSGGCDGGCKLWDVDA